MILTKIWISFLAVLILAGCIQEHTVKLPAAEDLRILSLVTAADHIIAELGCKEKISAIDRHGRILESMRDVPVTVAGSMVSREMLRKYRINCAVIWYYQQHLKTMLQKENVFVITVEPQDLESYSKLVRQLSKVCNQQRRGELMIKKFEKFLSEIPPAEEKKSVYIELYAPWKSPAAGGYIDSLLQRAGGRLAAAGSVNGTISPEAVVRAAPEAVFYVEGFADKQDIANRTALRSTPAVKNSRIYSVPRKLLCEGVAPEELIKFFNDKIKEL